MVFKREYSNLSGEFLFQAWNNYVRRISFSSLELTVLSKGTITWEPITSPFATVRQFKTQEWLKQATITFWKIATLTVGFEFLSSRNFSTKFQNEENTKLINSNLTWKFSTGNSSQDGALQNEKRQFKATNLTWIKNVKTGY